MRPKTGKTDWLFGLDWSSGV